MKFNLINIKIMKKCSRNFTCIISVLLVIFFQSNTIAQEKKSFTTTDNSYNDTIIMTWNKDTPESEMKDDSKALADKGITIKYSNIKRNSKEEITAIKVEYSDRKGNKGAMELDNQKPINTIRFFRQGETLGFGEPTNSSTMLDGNDFFNNFSGNENFMKQFNFGNEGENPYSQSFNFSFPNGESFGNSNSKIIIKKEGKKPLIIENGEVIEGGDDYSKEEIEKIKNENKVNIYDGNGEQFNFNNKEFDFRNQDGLENFKKQMEKMQMDLDKIAPNSSDKKLQSDLDKTTDEMIKAKEEMIKAKEEMEKAKKDLDKAKSTLKTQKS